MTPDSIPTEPEEGERMTWDEILDTCSRLHTTRQRPEGPWPDAEMREGSRMIDVTVQDRPAQIVPTRMHEPGFYWRYMDEPDYSLALQRSEVALDRLRAFADNGEVTRV